MHFLGIESYIVNLCVRRHFSTDFKMRIRLKIFAFFFGFSPSVNSQSDDVNINVIKLIDSAKLSFCKNDTLKTIACLETIEKDYPTDAAIVATNKALADLYLTIGRTREAKEKMLYAFLYKPTNYPAYRCTDFCNRILNNFYTSRAKADLCVGLSQLYLKQKLFDSSLLYLNLAENEFLPYKDCGNGIYMYKSFLSPYFADYYLTIGDTTKAIARLLDFFMKGDGDSRLLIQKLKLILLQRWTQKEITEQVDKGLRELKFIKADDDEFVISLTLFGHTIKGYGYG